MKIKTSSDLKYMHEHHQPHSYFFTRKTMKFFGDTMNNYGVRAQTETIETPCGDKHKCYVLYRRKPVKHGLQSDAYFDVQTFEKVTAKA